MRIQNSRSIRTYITYYLLPVYISLKHKYKQFHEIIIGGIVHVYNNIHLIYVKKSRFVSVGSVKLQYYEDPPALLFQLHSKLQNTFNTYNTIIINALKNNTSRVMHTQDKAMQIRIRFIRPKITVDCY